MHSGQREAKMLLPPAVGLSLISTQKIKSVGAESIGFFYIKIKW
jgi:hypothetical protein